MTQLSITIMEHAYKLSCKEDEESVLQEAARYLDEKMCAIRDNGKIKGRDKIAIMAALSISVDLMGQPNSGDSSSGASFVQMKKQIAAMGQLVDQALSPDGPLFKND